MSRRSSGDGAPCRRIVGDHPLIPLELRPGDIALVLVLEQHVPFGQSAAHAAPHALAAFPHADLVRGSPEGIHLFKSPRLRNLNAKRPLQEFQQTAGHPQR